MPCLCWGNRPKATRSPCNTRGRARAAPTRAGCRPRWLRTVYVQPFSQKSRTATVPRVFQIGLCAEAPQLRGRRGRFGTLLEQLECGIFGRTAVLGDDLFLWVGPCVRGACNGVGFFFVSSMNILLLWPSWPLSLTSCVSLPSSGGEVPPRDRTAVVDALFSVGCGLNTPCTPDGATTHLHVAARAKERRRPSLCAWCDAPRVGPTCRRRQRVGG